MIISREVLKSAAKLFFILILPIMGPTTVNGVMKLTGYDPDIANWVMIALMPFSFAAIYYAWFGDGLWRRFKARMYRRMVHNLHMGTPNNAWHKTPPRSAHPGKNRCGSGGQTFRPLIKTWQEIFNEWPADQYIKNLTAKELDRSQQAVMEELFFGYFAPLEAWCEQNFSGEFWLWGDQKHVNLFIMDEGDRTLWMLTWGAKLPNTQEISVG